MYVNYSPIGDAKIKYALRQSSIHRPGVTPEFCYGLTDHVEPACTCRLPPMVAAGGWVGSRPNDGTGDISDRSTFAFADIALGPDYALGHGYDGTRDHLILKAIVSVPFGRRSRG